MKVRTTLRRGQIYRAPGVGWWGKRCGVIHKGSDFPAPPQGRDKSGRASGGRRSACIRGMMKRTYEHEIRDFPLPYEKEDDVARRWWSLPPGVLLPLSNGASYRLLFAGRPGGPQGPDVRDAVFMQDDSEHRTGDVEFHVRSSDWSAHQHDSDARYNNVILHVVLLCNSTAPATRQDGKIVPLCSLYDLPSTIPADALWPCQEVAREMSEDECAKLLRPAGLLRFEQKTEAFVAALHAASPGSSFSAYDACLIPALAEALGYGRDRDFFLAAGLRLLALPVVVPEPLGRTPDPPPLDAVRLDVLRTLVARWRTTGAWTSLRHMLLPAQKVQPGQALAALRDLFQPLSSARTAILVCNVVLPFAAAVGQIERDTPLLEAATSLYLSLPGLPSNAVTRAMCTQLRLHREPAGACQQQGLHYIYQQTCREKRCGRCIAGRRML